jgi:hypothetical protein
MYISSCPQFIEGMLVPESVTVSKTHRFQLVGEVWISSLPHSIVGDRAQFGIKLFF